MAKVVRPIAFDEKRKSHRREKGRLSQQRRRQRQFERGGEWYYPSFMQRLVREPWDILFKGDDEGNDNV